ncbi:hypothetical protein ACP4OV_020971 [Aristida adscensionis]
MGNRDIVSNSVECSQAVNPIQQTFMATENSDHIPEPAESSQYLVIGGRPISRTAPPHAKPEGWTVSSPEKKQVTLGSRLPKLRTRRCKTCGEYAGHNSATCPTKPENQARLELLLQNRKRGRPKGSTNKKNQSYEVHDNSVRPTSRRRSSVCYTEQVNETSNSSSGDDTEDSGTSDSSSGGRHGRLGVIADKMQSKV